MRTTEHLMDPENHDKPDAKPHGSTGRGAALPEWGNRTLDFVNVLGEARFREAPAIQGYRMLTCWARKSGILCPTALDYIETETQQQQAEAAAVFARALNLRQTLYAIFSCEAKGMPADARDLAALNEELSIALCRRRLRRGEDRYHWNSRGGDIALDIMLWPIAYGAAELLVSDDLQWVRECRGTGCERLFLDTSRGRNRRWCDMTTCGNRAKARRHYERTKDPSRPL